MKVLLINSIVGSGSTGTLVAGMYRYFKSKGDDVKVAYGIGEAKQVPVSDTFKSNDRTGYRVHNIMAHLTDRAGFYSTMKTRRLIRFIKAYKPDAICLHTIHGYWINVRVLFKFLARYGRPVFWTLHDCWSFTGHCAHFDLLDCSKWRTGCKDCPGKKTYPASLLLDNSSRNYKEKRKLFLSPGDNLTLVPVSSWLSSLLKHSFFKQSTIQTIHNGIDLSIFRPVDTSAIIAAYHLENKKIVLGVANPWSSYKGLPDFVKLVSILPDDYRIVLIGLSEDQIESIPREILGLKPIADIDLLVQWYSSADVFVNPTYCDTYPTVNLEALACGTPVITYNTGGSPESVAPGTGAVVEKGDVPAMADMIVSFCNQDREILRRRAFEHSRMNFDKESCFEDYYRLIHSK